MPKDRIIKSCDLIIEYGVLAIVFFIPLIFDFSRTNFNSFDLFRIAAFRGVISLVLLVYVAKIFINDRIDLRGSKKIYLFSLFLLASFFISSLLSIHPNLSFWGSYERQQGFFNLVNYLLFFILLILNSHSFKQIERLIVTAVAAGAIVCFYGLFQLFGFDPLTWKEPAFATGRIFSSLGQANFLGHYLILIIPLSFYTCFFIVKKLLSKFFFGLVILAEFICLLNTYSRAAWLGLFASAILFILFFILIKKNRKLIISLAGLILIAVILIFSLEVFKVSSFQNATITTYFYRLKSIADLGSGSNKMRLYYWQASIKEIGRENYKRLLVGYGPDTLDEVFIKYYQPDWAIYEVINSYNDRAHCWPFDVILSYGLVGLASMLCFYIYFVFKVVKFLINRISRESKLGEEVWLVVALLASLVAYCVNNLFSFSILTSQVYLFLILAMLWLIVGSGGKNEIKLKIMTLSKILIWLALLAVVFLFIFLENINSVRADYYYMMAKKAEKNGDCQGLIDKMERAVRYNPKEIYYKEEYIHHSLNCFSLALALDDRLALSDNIEAQISSIKPAETRYLTRLTTARAYALFGFYVNEAYYEKAEEIFNKLIADYPYLLTSYQDLGRMKTWQKDYAGAIHVLKQAISLLPPLDNPQLNQEHKSQIQAQAIVLYERVGYSYSRLNDYSEALKYYKQALSFDPFQLNLYKSMADIYYLQGQLDQAVKLNQRGFMLNPTDYHWPLALSLLYRDKKDLEKAKEYLDQALKLAPENQDLKNYYIELNK